MRFTIHLGLSEYVGVSFEIDLIAIAQEIRQQVELVIQANTVELPTPSPSQGGEPER